MDEDRRFRWVGVAEAVSFLTLLSVAMPLKYIWGFPMAVRVTGWIHGLLFVAYVFLALQLGEGRGWPRRRYVFVVAAALLPFGPFVFDRMLFRAQPDTK